MIARRLLAGAVLCASLGAALCAVPAEAVVRAKGNGILVVEVQDAGADVGMFSIRTGASHAQPHQPVLYPAGTSYVTLRDNTAREIWTNAGIIVNTDIAPYVFRSMQSAPATTLVDDLADGFRVTHTLPNWSVQSEYVVSGTTHADTRVRHAITLTNRSAVTRSYGVRSLWDWDLAGIDALRFRTLRPTGRPTRSFFAHPAPAFELFEQAEDVASPTLFAYGTVRGGPVAAPPDRFGYVAWQHLFEAPWDTPVIGDALDSATVHYWGFVAPLALAPGASVTFAHHASTSATAIGFAPDVVADVPALAPLASALLAALVLACGGGAIRSASASSPRRKPRTSPAPRC